MTHPDYTIHCTEEQTAKAFKLGYDGYRWIPFITAEEMIGWLETQGIKISVYPFYLPAEDGDYWYCCEFETPEVYPCTTDFETRPEATLAVITKALEYLEQHQS